ncbi:hypothetical protein MIDIC_230088 [Alphaproteobacteria bacterium]
MTLRGNRCKAVVAKLPISKPNTAAIIFDNIIVKAAILSIYEERFMRNFIFLNGFHQ